MSDPHNDFDRLDAALRYVDAVKADAVLAFVRWLIVNNMTGRPDTLDAEDFIQAQGWSETPGQAERGKP